MTRSWVTGMSRMPEYGWSPRQEGKTPGPSVEGYTDVRTFEDCQSACCDYIGCKAIEYTPGTQECYLLPRTFNARYIKAAGSYVSNNLGAIDKDEQEAVKVIALHLSSNPKDFEGYQDLAFAFSEYGHPRAAIARITQAVQLQPVDADGYVFLSKVMEQVSEDPTSRYAQALDLQPTSPKMHANLIQHLDQNFRLQEAWVQLRKSLLLLPMDERLDSWRNLTKMKMSGLGSIDYGSSPTTLARTVHKSVDTSLYNAVVLRAGHIADAVAYVHVGRRWLPSGSPYCARVAELLIRCLTADLMTTPCPSLDQRIPPLFEPFCFAQRTGEWVLPPYAAEDGFAEFREWAPVFPTSAGPQDARTWWDHNNPSMLWVLYNEAELTREGHIWKHMLLRTLDTKTGILGGATRIKFGAQMNYEKNWSPFVHNGQLFLSYTLLPHRVLQVDTQTGLATQVHLTMSAFGHVRTKLRGGSPAARFNGSHYIAVGHTSGLRKTRFGEHLEWRHFREPYIYLFDAAPPFCITHASPPVHLFEPSFQQQTPAFAKGRTFFPVSLEVAHGRDQSWLLISWGFDDVQNFVSRVSLEVAFAQLHRVDCHVFDVESHGHYPPPQTGWFVNDAW